MEKKNKQKIDTPGLLRIYQVFGRHYKKYWKVLILAFLSLFAAVAIAVLLPWPIKLVLDHIILGRPLPDMVSFLNPLFANNPKLLLFLLAASVLLLTFLQSVFSYINKFWVSSTGDRMVADIRERVFRHLQRLSLSFHETARSGNTIYLLTSDVKEMKGALIDFPQDFGHHLLLFCGYAVVMFLLDWRLALVVIGIIPFLVLTTRYFGPGMRKAIKKKKELEGEVASIISENLTSMALVQAYGREATERGRLNKENIGSLNAQLEALRLQKTYNRIRDFLITLSTAGVLYFGGLYALQGDILPGTLVIFVTYLRDVFSSVGKFSELFLVLAKSQASGQRLLQLVESEMVIRDDPKAIPAPPLKGRIEFKNITFSYKNGKEVLKNLNLFVEPGQTVALVGHSGAGKSTLISLLLRFYDPQQGQILIDGEDIRKYTMKSLRDQITILLQGARLFRQTVRENIAFGKVGVTEEEIMEAARNAEIHDFIMELPDGYDTLISEGGDNFSGGQKQRINIARAIIRQSPVVVLDEPVTGLDAKAEAKVNTALRRLTAGRTTFIVAHRFSTIARADTILLLEDGQVADQGTHQELMGKSPQYRELFELQFGLKKELPSGVEDSNGMEDRVGLEIGPDQGSVSKSL